MARGGTPSWGAPPRRPASPELDPVPFPGGAEGALEFAAFEKGLLERGSSGSGSVRSSEPPPIARRTPISEPNRGSVNQAASYYLAAVAVAILLLLSSGLLATGFAMVLRAVAPP